MRKLRSILLFLAIFWSLFAEPVEATQTQENMEAILEINEGNKERVFLSSRPVILEVFSEECSQCMKLLPIFEEFYEEYGNDYRFATLKVEEENELTDYFHIRTLPTVLFIKDGEEVSRLTGNISRKKIKSEIKRQFCHE